MRTGILLCLAVLVAYRAGYEVAHITVANECERLGAFYVGSKTYRCVEITEGEKQ